MKHILIEKSKRVSVKPYQRKGKYVIGYTREDPRNRKAYLDSLVEKVKLLGVYGRKRVEKLPTSEQQYLVSRGVVFDVDRMGKPLIGYSREKSAQDLREKVTAKREHKVGESFISELASPSFVNVSEDTKMFIQRALPRNELAGLRSVEELDFKQLEKGAQTIPMRPYLEYLIKYRKEDPYIAGMYFPDLKSYVMDSSNLSFAVNKHYKLHGFLHEIGHHNFHYNKFITSADRKKYEEIYETERVSDYARSANNFSEGFAEAYAYYRLGILKRDKFPKTYDFMTEVLDRRRMLKKQNVLMEALGKSFKKGRSIKEWKEYLELEPEKAHPSNTITSIGRSKKDGLYYGWSHRAIQGFKTKKEAIEFADSVS